MSVTAPSLQVIARWSPVLYLHPCEKYMPVSVEWFIERASLQFCPHGIGSTPDSEVQTLCPAGALTQELLAELSETKDSTKLQLWLEKEHHRGVPPDRLAEVPVYAAVKCVVADDGRVEAFEISYLLFFAFNGAYKLLGLPCLIGIWYNRHRNVEGEWVAAESAPCDTSTGRPQAFVALNGHGTYPCAGTTHRLFFMANDSTSAKGLVWRPGKVVVLAGADGSCLFRHVSTRGSLLPHSRVDPHKPYNPRVGADASRLDENVSSDPHKPYNPRVGADASRLDENVSSDPHKPYNPRVGPSSPRDVSCQDKSLTTDPLQPSNPRVGGSKEATELGAGKETKGPLAAQHSSGVELTFADEAGLPSVALEGSNEAKELGAGKEMKGPLAAQHSSGVELAVSAEAGLPSVALEGSKEGRELWAGKVIKGQLAAQHSSVGELTFADEAGLPSVVLDSTSPWQMFKGSWGSSASPAEQCWMKKAEPPVSRTWFQRVFLPLADGVEKLGV
eukprot:gene19274-25914_t